MGRAKLNMELISKEKSRNITLKKRKEGLIRKMHEFTTLCDVSACMIIYGPKQDKGTAVESADIWPQDAEEVRRILNIYKSKIKDSSNKTFGLSDFFHERKRKIEEELLKLRKKNMESKYPTWNESMNFLTEAQLRNLASTLSTKAELVRERIEILKMRQNQQELDLKSSMDFSHHARFSNHFYAAAAAPASYIQKEIEFEVINQPTAAGVSHHLPLHYPHAAAIDHHSQNSMMMLLMNDNDNCVQFPQPNGNIQCAASFKGQVFYEAGRGVHMDPMIWANPRYYPPLLPPPMTPSQFMPCTMMQGMLGSSQLMFSSENHHQEGGQEDHHMEYKNINKIM